MSPIFKHLIIRALTHCEWKDDLDRLEHTIMPGQIVILKRDFGNDDHNAVIAMYGGRKVGYICRDDAPECASLLQQNNKESIMARVESFETIPRRHIVITLDCKNLKEENVVDSYQKAYDDWAYSFQPMELPKELKKLDDACCWLEYAINGDMSWEAGCDVAMKTFLQYHKIDFTDEVFSFRIKLKRWLATQTDTILKGYLDTLEKDTNELTKPETYEVILDYLDNILESDEFKKLIKRFPKIDYAKNEMQLCQFPDGFYSIYLNDKKEFAHMIFYHHPHRLAQRKFYTALARHKHAERNGIDVSPGHSVNKNTTLNNYGTFNNMD